MTVSDIDYQYKTDETLVGSSSSDTYYCGSSYSPHKLISNHCSLFNFRGLQIVFQAWEIRMSYSIKYMSQRENFNPTHFEL